MDHTDHVALIRAGLEGAGARWLELGAGSGAFTLALLDLVGDEADVVAIDRDQGALRSLEQAAGHGFPRAAVQPVVADFTQPLPVEPASFDGVLMANSLHFVRDKATVLRAAIDALRPGGRFLIVEYGSDRGNTWVPWPISYPTWAELAEQVGLLDTRRIGEVPSRFLGSIYAAVSQRDGWVEGERRASSSPNATKTRPPSTDSQLHGAPSADANCGSMTEAAPRITSAMPAHHVAILNEAGRSAARRPTSTIPAP